MQYLGSKIWNLIPMEMKSANNLQIFKANIKTWIKNYVVRCRFLKLMSIVLSFLRILYGMLVP